MIDRKEVYAVIDSERDHQERKGQANGTAPEAVRPHSVEEFVLYMDDYLREMKTQLSRIWTPDRKPPPESLATLRKIVALGVACMEQHGAPRREQT